MFIRPQRFEAIVRSKEYLTSKVVQLTLELIQPNNITFQAGQFISLEVEAGEYRAYSITSSETDLLLITLLIEVSHEGKGSNFTNTLKVGDTVNFIGPSGKFTFPPILPNHLVFIATGVGFAPFEAMLSKLINDHYEGKVDVFFGIRTPAELFKIEFLKKAENSLKNFSYTLCYSRIITSGRVTHVVPQKLNLGQLCNAETLFLICGSPAMVTDMTKILAVNNINPENILFEKFA